MLLSGLGDINTVAQTIQQIEGDYGPGDARCHPPCPQGTLAWRNNNPGNLRLAGQPGATQGAGGFAAFPNYDAGYQALLNQISLNASSGMTIAQFTAQYAPASDGNDPASYAAAIASAAGVSVNDPLSAALSLVPAGSADSTSLPIDATVSGIDLTDPATLALVGVAALLAWAVL